jgi:large conductance mechanosensitive channel
MKQHVTGFLKAFRAFALKGNVVDLAIAVVVGGAFGKIVTSLVSDVIMPLVNPLFPGGDWRQAVVGPGIKLGAFAGTVVDFLVISSVLFFVIRTFERLKEREEAKPAESTPAIDPRIEAEARFVEALNRFSAKVEKLEKS